MSTATAQSVAELLELAESLRCGRERMTEPQDLPGRYGRVVKAVDRLLRATNAQGVVGGGWAVWRHGFVGRVTQDVDIVVAANRISELLRVAAVSGFEVLPTPSGRWPKLLHKETGISVDILPEGERPGTPSRPAPTRLPHPSKLGASPGTLRYMTLPSLIELKLAAGPAKDESDVIELIRANPTQLDAIRRHLSNVHPDYAAAFDRLVVRSAAESEQA